MRTVRCESPFVTPGLIIVFTEMMIWFVQAIPSSSTSHMPQVVTLNGGKTGSFTLLSNFNDYLFFDHLLFVRPVGSKLLCALECSLEPSCMTFTLTFSECRGHCGRLSQGGLLRVESRGARTYERPVPDSTMAEFNLATGTATPLPPGVSYQVSLTSPNGTCTCSSQGVVALQFLPSMRSSAVVTLTQGEANYVTFFLGDTSSDGFGDILAACRTEIHSSYSQLHIFLSPNMTARQYKGFVNTAPHDVISVKMAEGEISLDNGATRVDIVGDGAFCVNTTDAKHVFLGLNRVAKLGAFIPTRVGVGLCRATVQFYP